jgi:hypothetical protein
MAGVHSSMITTGYKLFNFWVKKSIEATVKMSGNTPALQELLSLGIPDQKDRRFEVI